jgi:hypothetical protein
MLHLKNKQIQNDNSPYFYQGRTRLESQEERHLLIELCIFPQVSEETDMTTFTLLLYRFPCIIISSSHSTI